MTRSAFPPPGESRDHAGAGSGLRSSDAGEFLTGAVVRTQGDKGMIPGSLVFRAVVRVCTFNGIGAFLIERWLTKPFHPQTNGMVERFNRRIAQTLRDQAPCGTNGGKNKFRTQAERSAFLHRFVGAYNKTRLRCLDYTAPLTPLHNQAGDNTKAGMTAERVVQSFLSYPGHQTIISIIGCVCIPKVVYFSPSTERWFALILT